MEFVTWEMLATYAGALAMVLIVTQFTKNLSFIAKIPTQVWSYIVALLVLPHLVQTPGDLGLSDAGAFKAYNKVINEVAKIQKQCDKALTRTVNDMKSRAPAQVSKAVRQVYGVSAATMTEEGKKAQQRAGGTDGTVRLVYSGRVLTPTHFKMKPTTLPTKRAKDTRMIPGQNIQSSKAVGDVAVVNPLAPYQVTAEIYKGKRVKLPGQTFLGTNKGGGYIPFQREGDGRTPVKALKTVSIPQMITNEEVTYNGKVYVSLIDNNVWSPEAYPAGWQEVV